MGLAFLLEIKRGKVGCVTPRRTLFDRLRVGCALVQQFDD